MDISMRRLLALGVAVVVSLGLQGCESEAERALRLSCAWNDDIAITKCGFDNWYGVESGFSRCVRNCEYCRYGFDHPKAGQSDECNQLKCAAHCAKQESEACVGSYQQLCSNAVVELHRLHGNSSCDVDCSAATPMQRPGLAALLVAIVALVGHTGSRSCFMLGALMVLTFTLQGCGPECPTQQPALPDWSVNMAEMNKRAGCDDTWTLLWGSPCASDVPLVGVKKGVHTQKEQDIMRERVENEEITCIEWSSDGAFCQVWSVLEVSCDEQDFGMCTCHTPAANERYCQAWRCISKEAAQQKCRNIGGQNGESVHCDEHGTSPFPMNKNKFMALMGLDGTVALNAMSVNDQLAHLRQHSFVDFFYEGECIVGYDVKTPLHQCAEWREIETEIQTCHCTAPNGDNSTCQKWQCEELDAGQFSILFAGFESYTDAGLIERAEIEKYDCLRTEVTASNHVRCVAWSGHADAWEEVEEVRCEVCARPGVEGGMACSEGVDFVCSEYELPRIHNPVWLKRVGMAALHSVWIVPLASPFFVVPVALLEDSAPGEKASFQKRLLYWIMHTFGDALATIAAAGTISAIGFLRFTHGHWVLPFPAFAGIFFPLLCGSALTCAISLATLHRGRVVPAGVVAVPVLFVSGVCYAVGLVGVAPVLVLKVLALGIIICILKKD